VSPARLLGLASLALWPGWTFAQQPPPSGHAAALQRIAPSALKPESGTVAPAAEGRFTLERAVSRALIPGSTGSAARLRFTYRGPTRETAPLASGELRRQIGLKLRAHDTCNVFYVMWHLEPTQELAVQVKSNPSLHTHEACRDHGYASVPGRALRALPPIAPGEPHELAAFIEGGVLEVELDGQPAWKGSVPASALALEGPAGVRSDNGEFEVELWAELRAGGR
jgi:hypothetical protein